jgi:hypothetical protein
MCSAERFSLILRYKNDILALSQGVRRNTYMDSTNADEPFEEIILDNAEQVIKIMKTNLDVNLAYDEASVEWLDGYIERNRSTLAQHTIDALIEIFGSFLGECIRHKYGGKWVKRNGDYAVQFENTSAVFPLAKVEKQFKNGYMDSILGLYTLLPHLFKLGQDDNSS